jgi:hypothetical protein
MKQPANWLLKASGLVLLGLATVTPSSGENIATITQFCASSDQKQTIACCKANEKRLALPLATGKCETSVSCSVIKGMNQTAGPNCRLVYGPEIWDLLAPDRD